MVCWGSLTIYTSKGMNCPQFISGYIQEIGEQSVAAGLLQETFLTEFDGFFNGLRKDL